MAVSKFNPKSIKIEEKDNDLVIISSDDELEEDKFYKIKGKSILRVSGFEAMTRSSSSLSKLGKRRDHERKKDKVHVDDRKRFKGERDLELGNLTELSGGTNIPP